MINYRLVLTRIGCGAGESIEVVGDEEGDESQDDKTGAEQVLRLSHFLHGGLLMIMIMIHIMMCALTPKTVL